MVWNPPPTSNLSPSRLQYSALRREESVPNYCLSAATLPSFPVCVPLIKVEYATVETLLSDLWLRFKLKKVLIIREAKNHRKEKETLFQNSTK